MALLLLLTSILLALSGVIKIRSGLKAGMGFTWLPLLELAAAAVAAALVMTGLATSRTLGWLVPGGVLLVILSSSSHLLKLDAHRRAREARLGARLNTYVRYLSGSERDSEEQG